MWPELLGQLRTDFERHVARFEEWRNMMIDLPTLLTDISALKTDIETLIADMKTVAPVDLQPAADAIAAIDTAVKAAIPPAPAAKP
jgi:hypothetical protein